MRVGSRVRSVAEGTPLPRPPGSDPGRARPHEWGEGIVSKRSVATAASRPAGTDATRNAEGTNRAPAPKDGCPVSIGAGHDGLDAIDRPSLLRPPRSSSTWNAKEKRVRSRRASPPAGAGRDRGVRSGSGRERRGAVTPTWPILAKAFRRRRTRAHLPSPLPAGASAHDPATDGSVRA